MINGSKLLSSFAVSHLRVSAIYSFLKYLRYIETSNSNQGRRKGDAWRGHCPLPYERGGNGVTGALT